MVSPGLQPGFFILKRKRNFALPLRKNTMTALIFASHNPNKVKEIQEIVPSQFRIVDLNSIGIEEEIEETGVTLDENADIKAQWVFNKLNQACFADDTGLEIEALNGEPGVYSARYAGESKSANKNIKKVLEKLNGVSNRKARFRTVMTLIVEGKLYRCEGVVHGVITDAPRGTSGFGYDPIFQPDGFSKTFAEMTSEEKHRISHRALALHQLVQLLERVFLKS